MKRSFFRGINQADSLLYKKGGDVMSRVGIGWLFFLAMILLSCDPVAQSTSSGEPPVAVEVVKASLSTIEDGLDVVGILYPKQEVFVRSEFPAKVAEVYVSDWVPVKKGQPLAKLDTREFLDGRGRARAALIQAEAQMNRAQREYDRAVKLHQLEAIARQSFDDAKTNLEAAVAAVDSAKSELNIAETRLEKALICSPIDGVVSMRAVNAGDTTSGETIFRIVKPDSFDLRMNIPSGRIHSVKVGQEVSFLTDTAPGKIFKGVISHINPALDEASRTVKVTARILNPGGGLKAGLFVKGRILSGIRKDTLVVPRSAFNSWNIEQKKAELFVLEGDKARKRPVSLGIVQGETAQIVSGLKLGEAVITRGAFLLHDGDRVMVSGRKRL